ncbi:hypothetical protein [Erythrobacter colymbi]|uniref:hypothetical protein n=1 Tax=Erythrobacter colymbi TaxID=1161202 RepID=UPI001180AF5C|nr:hypothetical protein [Erythrobacter colymbi]
MSRYLFSPSDDYDGGAAVVVGWDSLIESYFFQYGDVCSDLPLMLATGQRRYEHWDWEIVLMLARHFGKNIPDDLESELLLDPFRDSGLMPGDQHRAPERFILTHQAYNGVELSFSVDQRWARQGDQLVRLADQILEGFGDESLASAIIEDAERLKVDRSNSD